MENWKRYKENSAMSFFFFEKSEISVIKILTFKIRSQVLFSEHLYISLEKSFFKSDAYLILF